ncbi:LysM domain-containing protein [Microsporum canis CBS 113480]|uniref:LysM domain-containing protein n=1 Tax=Arthroderma otae (strain ATCC MYA-4605 / CBS 113480) TaxID=554155 RepID=C5FU05_ARTOC|nr:LysM domain-containing protein [Microsporum canis CBS 113480]EEQ33389.1 LysM domain-containing protein [Microsporum canis CBS 113480]
MDFTNDELSDGKLVSNQKKEQFVTGLAFIFPYPGRSSFHYYPRTNPKAIRSKNVLYLPFNFLSSAISIATSVATMVSTQLILSAIVLFGVSNTSAAALRPRACSFMSPAATGDTCQSLASDWGINLCDDILNAIVKDHFNHYFNDYFNDYFNHYFNDYFNHYFNDSIKDFNDYFSCNDFSCHSSGTQPSYYVCIGVKGTPTTPPKEPNTPKPTQPNVNPKCNKWYKVVSGDYCQKISDQFHIPLQDFYKWNPDVGNACASLWADYNVCVGSA